MERTLRISLSSVIGLGAIMACAQVPNAGFEDWADMGGGSLEPTGWFTTNAFPMLSVEQYAPAYAGNYAMQVHTWDPGFQTFQGMAMITFAYAQRPEALSVCMSANVMPGDRVSLVVALAQGDSIIASPTNCTFWMDTSVTQYTCLSFPITYNADLNPDSCHIIVIAGQMGTVQLGTEIVVDELAFELPTGVMDPIPHMNAGHAYPDPAVDLTTIPIQLEQSARVELSLFNSNGHKVRTVPQGMLPAGRGSIPIDVRDLANGVYHYVVRSGSQLMQGKLAVVH